MTESAIKPKIAGVQLVTEFNGLNGTVTDIEIGVGRIVAERDATD